MFKISTDANGTIHLVGKMHDAHSKTVLETLQNVTESCTVDFSELVYISSSGLGLLLQAQKKLEASGHGLTLTGMSDHVRELFAITRFDILFDIK